MALSATSSQPASKPENPNINLVVLSEHTALPGTLSNEKCRHRTMPCFARAPHLVELGLLLQHAPAHQLLQCGVYAVQLLKVCGSLSMQRLQLLHVGLLQLAQLRLLVLDLLHHLAA